MKEREREREREIERERERERKTLKLASAVTRNTFDSNEINHYDWSFKYSPKVIGLVHFKLIGSRESLDRARLLLCLPSSPMNV